MTNFIVIILMVIAATLAGILTSFGQAVLPDELRSFANSSGGWSIIVFWLAYALRRRPGLSAALGVLGFLGLNAGYAILSSFKGYFWSLGIDNVFIILSFVVGPIVGAAAALVRTGGRLAAVAAAVLPAILIADGIFGLTVIADTTSPVYWTLSILGGIAMFVWAGLKHPGVKLKLAASFWLMLGTATLLLADMLVLS